MAFKRCQTTNETFQRFRSILYLGQINLKKREIAKYVHESNRYDVIAAAMVEWLRRWTRNPMGYSRAGSNPVRSVNLFYFYVLAKLALSCIKCL